MLGKIKSTLSPKTIAEKYKKYEKYISPGGLIAGFIIDNLTLSRADIFFDNVIIVLYLLIVCAGICILNLWQRKDEETESKVHFWALLATQFAFGGLFSNFLVFYSRSSTFATSWLFIIFLAANLIGTEVLKKKYQIFSFQISVLFLAIYSYFIFLVPVIFRELSTRMFLLSGALSIVFISLFVLIFFYFTRERFFEKRKQIRINIAIVFAVINIFYFTNIIPPVPLTLKDAGVYHNLSKTAGGYQMFDEVKTWRDYFRIHDVVHLKPGEPAYLYSSVYSPTELNTSIVHHWQYFDENKTRWVSASKVSVPIVGGREGGYRLYSINPNAFPALWRVDIETLRGQVIGRVKFNVENTTKSPDLIKEIK